MIQGQLALGTPLALARPGSANRDPAVFPDPDRYDVSRKSPDKVSFGAGRHRCLGARLARLQARLALGAMAAAVAGYEVDESAARRVTAAEARGVSVLADEGAMALSGGGCGHNGRPAGRPR
ncbi:cytochrome P450 [Streptomyces orinoci]|uniref:Cytochrome P450 n=1 Tax=Streptomyces orinoci TaxID=67339 RepID=A0ABV3K0S3_STRON